MKATAIILAAGLVLGTGLGAIPSNTLFAADPAKDADALMKQARQAIKDGKYDQADQLLTQAEKTGFKPSALSPWSDTPAKLRKLMADEKARTSKPSGKFPVLFGAGKDPKSIPQDPLKPVSPEAQEQNLNKLTADAGQAKRILEAGRQALRNGNVPEAVSAYQKAQALAATYGPNDYQPADLAEELMKAGVDLSQMQQVAQGVANIANNVAQLTPDAIPLGGDRFPGMTNAGGPPANFAPASDPYAIQNNNGAAERLAPRSGGQYPVAQPLPQPNNGHPAKAEAQRLTAMARAALDQGNVAEAGRLADQAQALNVPDEAFGPNETRPWQVRLDVNKAVYRREGVMPAGGMQDVNGGEKYPVARGVYSPENDTTKNVKVRGEGLISERLQSGMAPNGIPNGQRELPIPGVRPAQLETPIGPRNNSVAGQLYEQGMQALVAQDRDTAMAKFQEAWRQKDQLDPLTQKQLADKLTSLRAGMAAPEKLLTPEAGRPTAIDAVNAELDVNRQRLVREIAGEHKKAQETAQKNPRGALADLKKLRERVASAEVENAARVQLLRLVDKYIGEVETYIGENAAAIELDERNQKIQGDIDRGRDLKLESQNKLAELVDGFNKLMDEGRYAEAELKARQAKEIAPSEAVTENMIQTVRLVRAARTYDATREAINNGVMRQFEDLDSASVVNVGDKNPLAFTDNKTWDSLTKSRRAQLARERSRMSPAELEIQKSLSKPVEARFKETPLSEALDMLGRMAGINIVLDTDGIREEAITSNTPVTLELQNPVQLKSALNLILTPKRLSYVIQNEVLRVTSEQARNTNVYPRVYYVADLVMPIPNFTPSYNIGLPGALRESLSALGYGGGLRGGAAGPLTVANENAQQQIATTSPLDAKLDAKVQAQMGMNGGNSGFGGRMNNLMPGSNAGPGGLGGGVQPDFDSLIQLITQTIQPSSWQEVGGPGSIEQFETNLSLVVSQTQEVHEQIADLLEQLRKLQDLQVTIEVRFITLSDSFFERIGVDFDFNIDDNSGRFAGQQNLQPNQSLVGTPPNIFFPDDNGQSFAVGLNQAGLTPNLDFQFQQNGFGSATPPFGTIDPNAAATFGFAILSDIEVFLFLNAVQGDDRTNVLQAPKVTLFNGQQAYVSDTSQRPFVTSVIPVVGDFAAAYQPVIVVLSEGTSLSVQAVVSPDRRFCRLTLVPFFSQIGDVETFTFTGRVTTDTGTNIQDPANPNNNNPIQNNQQRTVEGTTVQLPTFAFTTVATTVSVPDGGTVLLGGVKRLREGRRERGVPLLSKVPYVSRLFRNVGIGRDAQSLMMMVTPRIIIQEEEENKLGIEDLPK